MCLGLSNPPGEPPVAPTRHDRMRRLSSMARMRLIDLLSRKSVAARYALLSETQWWRRHEMEELQISKLRLLLAHCERNVPFYRDVIRRQRIAPDRVDSLAVLHEFPVIDKATIKANADAFRSTSTDGLGLLRYSQTGGTTGEPLRFAKDAGVRSAAQAAVFRFHDWMGIAQGDRQLVLWGAPIAGRSRHRGVRDALLRMLLNTRQVDAFSVGRAELPGILRLLRTWRPRLLHGYCLSVVDLARWMIEVEASVPVHAVSTTVEPLFDEDREVLRRAFGRSPFDQYGCGEVESIAMECESHAGLHVTEERVVLELGAEGEVILTDLDNRAFPFIRYRNGDLAELADAPCPCGRSSRLLRRILGRTGDVITGLNGRRLHPEFFTHLLNETRIAMRRDLRRYQVVQESAARIVWKLVSQPLTPEEHLELVTTLRDYLGPMEITIAVVDDIPRAISGKYRYVVNLS